MASRTRKSTAYADHPGVAMERKAIAGLREKTGRSLEEWTLLLRKSGPKDEGTRARWLEREHGLGTNYAAWIAERAKLGTPSGKPMEYDPDGLVAAMFAGPRAGLVPLYERLLELGRSLGKDVTVTPCSTIVPLRRKYVFAQIKPTTRTRIDLGFALGTARPTSRLLDTGGFAKGDRITHKVEITALADIDGEVKRWFKAAYELGNESAVRA
jgi:uncharacterized protein DUF5655/uncharacterized protein DUF4287